MSRGELGLFVHRGSRIERLAQVLAGYLESDYPDNPLTAQTVVVAHAGLGRWLLGEFSRRPSSRGGHGIAANFHMILPWQWLDGVARDTLGEAALIGGPWRREVLRWHVLAALSRVDAPRIKAYLDGEDSARRSFQLAEHLAGVYTQYLVYRPDWIDAWERPAARSADDWQAQLWWQVQAAVGKPHRAHRRAALIDALNRGGIAAASATPIRTRALKGSACVASPDSGAERERRPLHVFGVSHLAPDVLDALRACSLLRPVHLYFPDPCREHWSYLRSHRDLLRREDDPFALYFEVGHPLLVSLGRVAQDFCLALDDIDALEERDPFDEREPAPASAPLLDRVQSSIRCMQPDVVGGGFREALARASDDQAQAAVPAAQRKQGLLREARGDASLRVHACHTRLRELEVLKDALLRSLADDSTLQHRDIVVMAPDIAAYAPYLAAVFGEPACYRSDPLHVPWHLADVGLASTHPLMNAFAHLLDLAESRFAVSEVLGLLDVPALARRFSIDAPAREMLERWLRGAQVAWGLDAAMKEQVGAAPIDANSWKFGFDRLYAGLIAGNDGAQQLLDGIAPLVGVGGSAIDALGQLDRLIEELRHLRAGFATSRSLVEWSGWLADRLDALFVGDPREESDNAAIDTLRRMIGDLAGQAHDAGLSSAQPWTIVREVLQTALQSVPERQAFLLGGVTFCGLVPQRSIPFRMVCLLGMNEGEFPRAGGDAGLNRMREHPRRGDRDTRNEDRYLFLEALMAARERLHISYVGIGVQDGKARNPASPLAELLQFLDEQHALAAGEEGERPWKLAHPLQPFDARYYERDARGDPAHDSRLFSYDATFVARADAAGGAREDRFLAVVPSRLDPPERVHPLPVPEEVSLAALNRFWRDPAKDVLLRSAGISLDALDADTWPDREPLEAVVAPLQRFDRQLLFDALESGASMLPPSPPAWLSQSGLLAAGALGERAYAQALDGASLVLAATRARLAPGRIERIAQAIDLDLGGGMRLTGKVERVFRAGTDRLLLLDVKPGGCAGFREWLPFFIDWAALRLTLGERVDAMFIECAGGKKDRKAGVPALLASIVAQDDASLCSGLLRLIEWSRRAPAVPLLFFPKTAWEYAITDPDRRMDKARTQWLGGEFVVRGERDYSPGYADLLTRGVDLFDAGTVEHGAFVESVAGVCGVLDPAHALLLRELQPARAAAVADDAGGET